MHSASERTRPHEIATGPDRDAEGRLAELFLAFQPISLEKTNEMASMQSRIDNKYLVNLQQFRAFLQRIETDYKVLEIAEKRQFSYRSCYYDDNFRCYFQHHQGRRQRLKVRTRKYVDGGGMQFLEIKLKGPRGITVKHRSETDRLITPKIAGEQLDMLRATYSRQYKKTMRLELSPALIVSYQRCTLVAMEGGERVTIDYRLGFARPAGESHAVELGCDFIIIETKSANGKGIADRALKALKVRPASRCSKYCIGVNLTGSVQKNNNFLATIKHARRNISMGHSGFIAPAPPLGFVG